MLVMLPMLLVLSFALTENLSCKNLLHVMLFKIPPIIKHPYCTVVTGAKVRQEIYEAFENIYPILKSFKK